MDISSDMATWAVSGIASAGVAFGVIKTQLRNTMTYEKHREICEKERTETNRVLDKLFDSQRELHGMIKEIHGFLKAKNGGNL